MNVEGFSSLEIFVASEESLKKEKKNKKDAIPLISLYVNVLIQLTSRPRYFGFTSPRDM